MIRYSSPRDGFSLVELSIVLVILGLLTGGILSGQSLIRASQLRSITVDFQRYATAVRSFRDKYQSLPGDMNNATQFWGFAGTTVSPGCVTRSSAAIKSGGTCDGNGDGTIDYGATASSTGEAFTAWQQLALAGLVEGQYSGNAGNIGGVDYVIGTNAPASKINPAGWMISYLDNTANYTPHLFQMNYLNWLGIGTETLTNGSWADDGFLKNDEAWNIDTKLDDGKPGTGSVQAMGLDTGCTPGTSNTDTTVTYDLGSTVSTACALLFRY